MIINKYWGRQGKSRLVLTEIEAKQVLVPPVNCTDTACGRLA